MKMLNKVSLFSIVCLTALVTTSCTAQEPEVLYVTPSIKGKLIDRQTDQPISNVKVYLTDNIQSTSDDTGRFELPTMQKIDTDEMGADYFKAIAKDASVMIDTQGYQRRLFAIDGMAQFKGNDSKTPVTIDLGDIYLKPLPAGIHRYGTVFEYIDSMPYCKPTQSQREVDCIPVTEGKKYEQVSPNQPVQ
ncbi:MULTISPECIES: hypothetical protein [Psychrobacter]|uniref:hypothetical protein n=1 Tax=Psychrobacter TaxID=497 RepID=UPI00191B1063|nr:MULTISPECIES: hypothetical protein [Psychrobacter]